MMLKNNKSNVNYSSESVKDFVKTFSNDINNYNNYENRQSLTNDVIDFGLDDNKLKEECQDSSSYTEDSVTEIKTENNTDNEFMIVINQCRDVFVKKLADYGASWRIMRPASVTDQIYIKANRIRSLQEVGSSWVGEGIVPEFMAIVNYCIIGLIQIELGYSKFGSDITPERALEMYDTWVQTTYDLMVKKNHDYDEAWRLMRMNSYTDLILAKLFRTMQIEENDGKTLISEGIDSNYLDMINYAIFALIKFKENE